jgi:simple sugar transport system permease protein
MDTCVLKSNADRANFEVAGKIISKSLPFADKLGAVGEIFLSHGILVYLSVAVAVLVAWFLKKTRAGLHLRAVGENPATADAAGINVVKYKYIATCTGGVISGLGGLCYVMDYSGSREGYLSIEALGWLAIALVIFALWKPKHSIWGSFLFGGLYIVYLYIPGLGRSSQEIFKMLPYVVTLVVLVLTSMRKKREYQPPESLGTTYFREER